jgi:hypothetical protein
MSETATFFRNRADDPGETYELQIETPKGSYAVSIYARRPLPSSALKNHQVKDRNAVDRVLADLRRVVGDGGGGGWIVTAIDEGSARRLTARVVEGGYLEPVSRFWLLEPGRPAASVKADEKGQRAVVGSHLLVPVDETADQRLGEFVGHLGWLPPDLESLVLHAIRRPSLDARLNKVERKVFGETADDALRPGWGSGVKRWLRSNLYGTAALILLGLLLGAGGWWYMNHRSASTDKKALPSNKPAPHNGTAPSPDTRYVTPSDDVFIDDANTFVETLRAKHETSKTLQAMWDGHFKKLDEPLNENDIKALFRQHSGAANDPDNRRFEWGVIKLGTFVYQASAADAPFLHDWERVTLTRQIFDDITLTKIRQDRDIHLFLAALACRLGTENPPAPRLQTAKATGTFDFGGKCGDYTASHIREGLVRLNDVVNRLP